METSLAFSELFGAVFQRFHRTSAKRSTWTPQGWAVLNHLAMSGPLTVTEAARHMERAQSVMSEIVSGLERKGLLGRMRDARDRRRVLVWLTERGRAAMAAERQVLSVERLEQAFRRLGAAARAELLEDLRALVAAGEGAAPEGSRRDRPGTGRRRTREGRSP